MRACAWTAATCASRQRRASNALNGLVIHREKLDDATLNALTDCCPTQALTVCGEEQQVEEIMATVLRDKPFTAAAAAVSPSPAVSRL